MSQVPTKQNPGDGQQAEMSELEKFRQRLMNASEGRVKTLVGQDEFIVAQKDGTTKTLKYHPATVGEWVELQNMTADLLAIMHKYQDAIGNASREKKADAVSALVAQGKREMTAKAVEIMARSADIFLEIKYTGAETDDFYKYDWRQMVEILAACRFRMEHGDPNA